jgi:hypothetical protein
MAAACRSRFTLGTAIVLALVATPVAARAQFGIAAGVSVPGRDLGSESATGFDVTGMFNVGRPGVPIGFRGEAGINSFALKGTGVGTTRIFNLTGNILATPPSIGNAAPYVIAGVGVYRVNYSSGSKDYMLPAQYPPVVGRNGTDDRMGFNAGAGISFAAGARSVLFEVRYVTLATPSNKPSAGFVPIRIGVLF